MKFIVKVRNAAYLCNIVKCIGGMSKTIELEVGKDFGISAMQYSDTPIKGIAVRLSATSFDTLSVERSIESDDGDDDNSTVPLRFAAKSLITYLGCFKSPEDSVTFSHDASQDPDSVDIRFDDAFGATGILGAYKIALCNDEVHKPPINLLDVKGATEITLDSGQFHAVCKQLAKSGYKTVLFERTPTELQLTCKDDESDSKKAANKSCTIAFQGSVSDNKVVSKSNEEDSKKSNNSNISNIYSLPALQSFEQARVLAKRVTIRMSPDVPLILDYQLNPVAKSVKKRKRDAENSEPAQEFGILRYLLAPNIGEDEEI